jgi:4'-phosphopantetheinyl transferase
MRTMQTWQSPPTNTYLANHAVHVWQASLELPDADVAHLSSLLAPDERARAERFRFARDKRRYTVGRGVLRQILGRYLGVAPQQLAFTYNTHGKPALAELYAHTGIRFNLSHSGELALYAVSCERDVGVDIEQLRDGIDEIAIAERFFSAAERAELQALPPAERKIAFFRCWTRKEAYIKAHGDGLAMPLDQFSVPLEHQPSSKRIVTSDARESERWSFVSLDCHPAYAAAVVVEGSDWQLDCWRWL